MCDETGLWGDTQLVCNGDGGIHTNEYVVLPMLRYPAPHCQGRQAVLSKGNVAPSGSPVRVCRSLFHPSAAHPPELQYSMANSRFNY